MIQLTDVTTGAVFSTNVKGEQNVEPNLIVSKLYNGQKHIQAVGRAVIGYSLTAYVTRASMVLLQGAWADVDLIKADVKQGTWYGTIEDIKFSERLAGGYYKADIELTKEFL